MRAALILLLLLSLVSPAAAGLEESLADLRSPDEAVALAAAESLDPHRLTLGELRLQAEILSRHPERIFRERKPRQDCLFLPTDALGAVDLPRVWAAAARMDAEPDHAAFYDLHRAMLADQLPALDVDDAPWAYPIIRRRVAAWYEKHRGTFRMSRILGGLVPVR